MVNPEPKSDLLPGEVEHQVEPEFDVIYMTEAMIRYLGEE